MHVVSSTGTDTYSAVAASLGSLKGPRHGGANIKVVNMIDDMQKNISKFDDKHIESYLNKILEKKAFDNAGLIYGMGHAVSHAVNEHGTRRVFLVRSENVRQKTCGRTRL